MNVNYTDFFLRATGLKAPDGPYDYQIRLAGGDEGTACESKLIDIPTGMGKTVAVVLAWLWNRVELKRADWPRRLVYCLPMRTLVEQTEHEVKQWLADRRWNGDSESRRGRVGVHLLMGGKAADDWDLYPQETAILIGTQDMLLSRALNRGYGMSRYRWPMHFGLLNNDCLWVLDETQLMGVGLETSAQLEGFRKKRVLGAAQPSFTWWMSATLDEEQLKTVDAPRLPMSRQELSLEDQKTDAIQKRLRAEKRLRKAPVSLASEKKDDLTAYAESLAEWLLKIHQPGSLTLVVVNRVDRAQRLYRKLRKLLAANQEGVVRLALIHSRFRSCDRDAQQRILTEESGSRIVVATQAVEAGVDVSARQLVTELAPWPSLVQRFGRCHRYGEIKDGADVFWIDLEVADDKFAAPYSVDDLKSARAALMRLNSASLNDLAKVEVEAIRPIRPVIRRKDLVDLTDTTPDLAGYDLDISRYVRDSEDADVQVYWREIDDRPEKTEPKPSREELVRVSVPAFNKAFKASKDRRVWEWSHVDRGWRELVGTATPGRLVMVKVSHGGYDADLGWTGDKKHKPTPRPPARKEIRDDHDPLSDSDVRLGLAAHTGGVRRHLGAILDAIPLPDGHRQALETAANWHDVGKAHHIFREALLTDDDSEIWAKGKMKYPKERPYFYRRPHFRHELASALAWLQERPEHAAEIGIENLVAYLIAAHHGKVRFSLRAMPGEPEERSEKESNGGDAEIAATNFEPPEYFARGIWQGDNLGPLKIPEINQQMPKITLDLSLMRLGAGSWLERMLTLRDDTDTLGPFRLAFLEALLRAADIRASAEVADASTEP